MFALNVANETLPAVDDRDCRLLEPVPTLSLVALSDEAGSRKPHRDLKQNQPTDDQGRTAKELVGRLEAAFSLKTATSFKDIWHLLAEEDPDTIASAQELMSPLSNGDRATYKENFDMKLRSVVSTKDAIRIQRMLTEKCLLEIPVSQRSRAADLVIGSTSGIGRTQKFVLPGGREFDVFVPRALRTYREDGENRVPSIVALHGVVREAAADKYHIKEQCGLNQVAERHGVVVIYPRASAQPHLILPNLLGWSAPNRENILSMNPKINDSDEISKMRQFVRDNIVPVGKQSGFIGHSDGGRMAQAYAIERPDEVAYLVPWSSTWMINDAGPTKGVPTRIILNDADETLPVKGGRGRISRWGDLFLNTNVSKSRPLMMIDEWSAANNCSQCFDSRQEGKITRQTYKGCEEELEVDVIHGSGHSMADWHSMGGTPNSPADTSLNMTYDVVKGMMPYLTNEHGNVN
jgi:poly(3-hydroxybutyrate) depolymerase